MKILDTSMRYLMSIMLLGCLIGTLGCNASKSTTESVEPSKVSTVFIVRHAERPDGVDDLNEVGIARAYLLEKTLENANISVIYASTFNRTQQTVKPLADALGITTKIYDPSDLAALALDIKTHHKGKVVLVAGHSNTVPETATHLGVTEELAHFHHDQYDNLYMVILAAGHSPHLVKLKYGHIGH